MVLNKWIVIVLTTVGAVVTLVITLGVGLALWLPSREISLEFWPKPDDSDSSLISYNKSDSGAVQAWTRRIDNVFDEYRGVKPEARFRVHCSPHAHLLRGDEVCDVRILDYGPCSPFNLYGYPNGKPCVFLRLPQISEWVPEPYSTSYGLPPDMPEDLKALIRNSRDVYEASQVWVSCEGENSTDKENIGPIQYFPGRGFPTYYFPFTNKPGYLSPYIAVHFERIASSGILVNVECRAWAHNIHYDRYQRRGSVHFEIMLVE